MDFLHLKKLLLLLRIYQDPLPNFCAKWKWGCLLKKQGNRSKLGNLFFYCMNLFFSCYTLLSHWTSLNKSSKIKLLKISRHQQQSIHLNMGALLRALPGSWPWVQVMSESISNLETRGNVSPPLCRVWQVVYMAIVAVAGVRALRWDGGTSFVTEVHRLE